MMIIIVIAHWLIAELGNNEGITVPSRFLVEHGHNMSMV